MRPDDDARLRHMLDAADDAARFVVGRTRKDLDSDRMLALALVKCIEIVGEAASRLSDAGKARAPSLPWPDIVGMRHRLIHAYYDVDLDRVWDTITVDLPVLTAALREAVSRGG